jgi:hypothetical protein
MENKNKLFAIFFIGLVLGLLVLSAYELKILGPNLFNKTVTTTPEQTVAAFYNQYLQTINQGTNPLNEKSYQENKYLTDQYKEKTTTTLEDMQTKQSGYDPILCAQDIPTEVSAANKEVEENKATVIATLSFGQTTKNNPVHLIKKDNLWLINDIDCTKIEQGDQETVQAVVYFNNSKKTPAEETDCGYVYGVERTISAAADYYQAVLNELFTGPTEKEQEQGYFSLFSPETADILESVRVKGDTAYVNLKDIRTTIPSANASCASRNFFAQVEEALKHKGEVEEVIFAINSNPETFYQWMQLGCTEENNNCDPTPFQEK